MFELLSSCRGFLKGGLTVSSLGMFAAMGGCESIIERPLHNPHSGKNLGIHH
jgi:hypothetical protein